MYLNREHRFVGEIQGELYESANVHLYRGETENTMRAKLLKFVTKIAEGRNSEPLIFQLLSIWYNTWESEWQFDMKAFNHPSSFEGQSYPVNVSPVIDFLLKNNCDEVLTEED